ncbi:MAG TPA: hypothetical protein VI383_09025 [Gemmatimonadales bacterium]|nr:hypothetical protein [Gemmatimonadales bacterium]
MPAARTLVLLFLLLAGTGCGTEPSDRRRLGLFGGPLADRTAYLALGLTVEKGLLSGRAWSSYSQSLTARAQVIGRYDPPAVTLTIQPSVRYGLRDWYFEGELEGDTLRGILSQPGTFPQPVELVRAEAIPLGDYSLKITGAVEDSATGWAQFNYLGGSFRLVQIFAIQDRTVASMAVFWYSRDRPRPGTYAVSAEGGPAPAVRFSIFNAAGSEVRHTVRSGYLVIEESGRYVLAGRFLMTATDPVGREVTLHGVFSSGCTSNAC